MRSVPVRHEGQALADMGRQYSAVSRAALKRLASLEGHFGDLQARVDDVEKKVSAGTLDDLLESKNELAQINGLLEKFQFNQLDAVTTAELNSGKENAKVMRKQLNQAVEDLQQYTAALHKRISEQVEELKQQQRQGQGQGQGQAQEQQPSPQAETVKAVDEVDEGSQHGNNPKPESNKGVKEKQAPQTLTQQAESSNEQPQQEQEAVQPKHTQEAQDAERSHAESQTAMEMSPPPQPPTPTTTAVPAGISIPVRRRQAEVQAQMAPSQRQQQTHAQTQADPRRVPVHVGRSSQSRQSQPFAQQGLSRQQAAAMLQAIGLGYQHGMINAHTRAVLKDRVLRQDPRLINVWPTGDVYNDLTAMVRVLQQ